MNGVHLNILIAEDEPAHATAVRRSLEKTYPDAVISVVTSIQEFSEHLAVALPSIALLDLNLSDGSAIDLITAPSGVAAFPTIVMTSFGSEPVAVDSIKRGAMNYLVKTPDAFATVGTVVAGALREWQLLQDKSRMELQLKESQARIIQQEKMASIGQLAAGVAHEINNPMGYITSNLNTLWKYSEMLAQFIEIQEQAIEKCADDTTKASIVELKRKVKLEYIMKDFRELISESLDGSKRVSKIVQDLKSFSRADGDEAIPADLNACIRSTVNVVQNEIKYVAELTVHLGDLPLVVCRPQQISQVVMNLLVNAAHSISEKGVITLETVQVEDMVEIRVADTGCGITAENLTKIFEPFFTTKEVGKGTGLGLAISSDIIRKHDGELLVESDVGTGSTFTVKLPITGIRNK